MVIFYSYVSLPEGINVIAMSSSIASAQKAGVSILCGANSCPSCSENPHLYGFLFKLFLTGVASKMSVMGCQPKWIPNWKRHLTCKNAMNSQENMWIGLNNSDTSQNCSSTEHIHMEPIWNAPKGWVRQICFSRCNNIYILSHQSWHVWANQYNQWWIQLAMHIRLWLVSLWGRRPWYLLKATTAPWVWLQPT